MEPNDFLNRNKPEQFVPDGSDGDLQAWRQILRNKLTVAALVVVGHVFSGQTRLWNNNISVSSGAPHLKHLELQQEDQCIENKHNWEMFWSKPKYCEKKSAADFNRPTAPDYVKCPLQGPSSINQ